MMLLRILERVLISNEAYKGHFIMMYFGEEMTFTRVWVNFINSFSPQEGSNPYSLGYPKNYGK